MNSSNKLEKRTPQDAENFKTAIIEIVDDAFLAAASSSTFGERLRVADVWARLLFGVIPEARLKDCFDFAFARHTSPFPVNAYDLNSAWETICETEKAEADKLHRQQIENNPVLACGYKGLHRTPEGDIEAFNPYSDRDELMPCPHCRPEELVKWKKNQIALYGEIPPAPISPAEAVSKGIDREKYLDPQEAQEIAAEFNGLILKLVEDEQTQQRLRIVFDEGANCFRHPHRADILFSADVLKQKIKDYKEILEKQNA